MMPMSRPSDEDGGDDPLVGRVLSERYHVIRPIGEGGIGRVYLAVHLETQREVALKVLLPEFAGNLPLVDTFLEEARTVSRLGHPHIIDIFYGGAPARPSWARRSTWRPNSSSVRGRSTRAPTSTRSGA